MSRLPPSRGSRAKRSSAGAGLNVDTRSRAEDPSSAEETPGRRRTGLDQKTMIILGAGGAAVLLLIIVIAFASSGGSSKSKKKKYRRRPASTSRYKQNRRSSRNNPYAGYGRGAGGAHSPAIGDKNKINSMLRHKERIRQRDDHLFKQDEATARDAWNSTEAP